MILEKLKEHGGKIMFFAMNILVVAAGVLFIKQKDTENANIIAKDFNAQNYKSAVDYALDAQQQIIADKVLKINSIANNPDTVQRQQGASVTKTIPAVTKTVTVQQPAAGSSTSSVAKATTKKS